MFVNYHPFTNGSSQMGRPQKTRFVSFSFKAHEHHGSHMFGNVCGDGSSGGLTTKGSRPLSKSARIVAGWLRNGFA